MSNTQFVEVTSNDPFVQKLGRRAIRLLNDPTLERWQREKHIRDLQKTLLEHQARQATKAKRLEEKKAINKRPPNTGTQAVADNSQIAARRKEFAQVVPPLSAALEEVAVAPPVVAIDAGPKRRLRPVLSLKQGR